MTVTPDETQIEMAEEIPRIILIVPPEIHKDTKSEITSKAEIASGGTWVL